jgi:RNA polymerase sigma factor for flagellar operon FliA
VLGPGDSQDKSFGAALPGDPADEDFTEHIEQRELLNALEHAINYLPTRERLVLALYYKEDLTLAEIAPLLGVSESRISQLKYRALERLRAALQRDRAA